jgi:hypothetical protein
VLGGRLYPAGISVTQATYQAGQVAGYAAAGLIVATAGVRGALVIDAVTFAASAAVIRLRVTRRPGKAETRPGVLAGARIVWVTRVAALALGIDLLGSFLNAPEGVAVPLAASSGHGAAAAGALLAAMTAGTAAGLAVAGRLIRPGLVARYAPVLAGAGCSVLIAFAVKPGVAWGMVILAVSGLCAGYMTGTGPVFAAAIPDKARGSAFGASNAALVGGQAVVILSAGGLAAAIGPAPALAVCGAAGVIAAVPLGLAWRRARPGKSGA